MGIFTPLNLVFTIIGLAVLATVIWAVVDAAIRPSANFVAAGKLTKPAWLAILVGSLILSQLGFLTFVALVAALVYLLDVRPRVRELGNGRNNTRMGPYGPW